MLSVRAITKRFGELRAVNGLSFDLRKGEAFGLLGPNGAGKSTTINIIIGVLAPDTGEVSLDGAVSATDAKRAIGVAPQSLSLYEQLSAEENLRFFGKLYGLAGAPLRDRVEWSLDLAGLADRRGGRVATFSGGMKRRLNIACALVHDPALVMLDEPTVGVDPQSRNYIFDAIERLKAEGRTILYTTHYMEEAERLCDRVAIMDKGQILALDTVDALIDAHGGASELRAVTTDGSALDGFTRDDRDVQHRSTNDAMTDVRDLVSSGAALKTLTVKRPDLESVFLALTGRTLRDD